MGDLYVDDELYTKNFESGKSVKLNGLLPNSKHVIEIRDRFGVIDKLNVGTTSGQYLYLIEKNALSEDIGINSNLLKNADFSDGTNNWETVDGATMKSSDKKGWMHVLTTGKKNEGMSQTIDQYWNVNESMAVSFKFKSTADKNTTWVYLSGKNDDGSYDDLLSEAIEESTETYRRKYVVTNTKNKNYSSFVLKFLDNAGSVCDYELSNVKVERSNKVTAFTTKYDDFAINPRYRIIKRLEMSTYGSPIEFEKVISSNAEQAYLVSSTIKYINNTVLDMPELQKLSELSSDSKNLMGIAGKANTAILLDLNEITEIKYISANSIQVNDLKLKINQPKLLLERYLYIVEASDDSGSPFRNLVIDSERYYTLEANKDISSWYEICQLSKTFDFMKKGQKLAMSVDVDVVDAKVIDIRSSGSLGAFCDIIAPNIEQVISMMSIFSMKKQDPITDFTGRVTDKIGMVPSSDFDIQESRLHVSCSDMKFTSGKVGHLQITRSLDEKNFKPAPDYQPYAPAPEDVADSAHYRVLKRIEVNQYAESIQIEQVLSSVGNSAWLVVSPNKYQIGTEIDKSDLSQMLQLETDYKHLSGLGSSGNALDIDLNKNVKIDRLTFDGMTINNIQLNIKQPKILKGEK